MRVLILGGAGFLGQKLMKDLLARGYLNLDGQKQELTDLTVFDKFAPALVSEDKRLSIRTGDLHDASVIEALLEPAPDIIFHLAAVVSGEAEKNFELGMQVNLEATLKLLEACRKLEQKPRLLFSSSIAVFGGTLPEIMQDDTAPTPQSSYGTQKAIAELLMNDYSRKGFIDGRVLRLPTVVVRPGKPNAATSSFASSIIREPLQGQDAVCPVSTDTRLWIMSPKKVIANLIHAAELSEAALGDNRIISLPGLTVSVAEMIAGLEAIAGKKTTARIHLEPDAFIQRIVGSWPSRFNPKRAEALGFLADASIKDIIQAFIDDDLQPAKKS